MSHSGRALAAAFFIVASVLAGSAGADTLDLTTAGASGYLGGAYFEQIQAQSTGTGTIDSFVRLHATGQDSIENGYNTTVNGIFDNTGDDPHNHEVRVSDLPSVTLEGTQYLQFLLDIDEPNATRNGPDRPLLSLDEIQIFTSSTANQSVESFASGGVVGLTGSLVYRLDASQDNSIFLNGALNSGNGSGDMFMYIAADLFGSNPDAFVYLYSSFGSTYSPDGGFEEWAHLAATPNSGPDSPSVMIVPEPATLSLLGFGLAGMAVRRFRRKA